MCRKTMAELKRLPEVDKKMDEVSFATDSGAVQIFVWEGEVVAKIGFEEVGIDEFEQQLDEVATHDEFTDEAEEYARDLIQKARQDTENGDNNEEEDETDDTEAESDDEDNTGEVVHTMDDGTQIRVGDRINHPGGWSYKITGKKDENTLRKMDNTDDWGVIISTAGRDIRQNGFDERVEEGGA